MPVYLYKLQFEIVLFISDWPFQAWSAISDETQVSLVCTNEKVMAIDQLDSGVL